MGTSINTKGLPRFTTSQYESHRAVGSNKTQPQDDTQKTYIPPNTNGSFRHVKGIKKYVCQKTPLKGYGKAFLKKKLWLTILHRAFDFMNRPDRMANHIRNNKSQVKIETAEQLKQQIEHRASEILNKLTPGSCLLVDFGNGEHTGLIICTPENEYHYFTYGATEVIWELCQKNYGWTQFERKPGESSSYHLAKDKICKDILEEFDFTSDKRNILLTDLDVNKMLVRGNKILENKRYSGFTFNCGNFATQVIKSGYLHIHDRPKNMCKLQMPNNAKKCAEEYQDLSRCPGHCPYAKTEREIDETHTLDSISRLHHSKVTCVKRSLRFRLKVFLFHIVGLQTKKEYYIKQVEKYICRHIMGDPQIKRELFEELEKNTGKDQKIMHLLSLLRLDATSIERVIKLDDPELLAFYLHYFDDDINRTGINQQGENILLCAIRNHANNIVLALLNRPETDTSLCDNTGNTPLILAAKKGNLEAVHLLLQTDPNLSETNKYGKTALDMAVKYRHFEVANLLTSRQQQIPS